MSNFRKEKDSFGEVNIPTDKLWDIHTQRSLENFPIGNEKIPISLIHAYTLVKKAAALANSDYIGSYISDQIVKSADEILSGKYDDQFPLKVWQTGSGTHTNMNINEVIANIANQKFCKDSKSINLVHPNDHVNYGMSTNDSFPTAMHIASVFTLHEKLLPSLHQLKKTLQKKVKDFDKYIKVGRTHLQDAVPLTVGQEFSGYLEQIRLSINRINNVLPHLLSLPMGGTAVGTGLNSHKSFPNKFIKILNKLTGFSFKESSNKFEGIATHDTMVELSGALNTIAISLMKISNDLRLLSSGPRCGLGELKLPENEAGSSIMPGKVNPSQIEALSMVCAQVMGNHVTVSVAGSNGHLQLNTFKPVIIYNVLQSINLLSDGVQSFDKKCLQGIEVNEEKIEDNLNNSYMLATALNPIIGYDKAAIIVKKAYQENLTLKQAASDLGFLIEREFDDLLKIEKLIKPRED
ncbi:MAG: fumarate hydratase, class II [Rickettsiales bacterium]|nr:fumarate hydratase, class II [Rickettsiales bacterium]